MEAFIKCSYRDKTIFVGLQTVQFYKIISIVTMYLEVTEKKMSYEIWKKVNRVLVDGNY